MILKSLIRTQFIELAIQVFFDKMYMSFCTSGLPFTGIPVKGQRFSRIYKGFGIIQFIDCTVTNVYISGGLKLTLVEFHYKGVTIDGELRMDDDNFDNLQNVLLESAQLFI